MDENVKNQETAAEEIVDETVIENEAAEAAEEKEEKKAAKKEKVTKKKENELLSKLEEEKNALQDKFLRLNAEFDNFRKRTQREKDATYSNASADTISKFLGVLDNLERALAASDGSDFAKGVELTYTQFKKVLTDLGVEEINPQGEAFNPNECNAVAHIESEDFGENVVSAVYQKGYKMNDKVLRPAMVQVAN